MEDTKTPDSKPPRGPGIVLHPRAALNALLDSGATAYEVCAYLTLAKSHRRKRSVFCGEHQSCEHCYRSQQDQGRAGR